MRRPSSPLVGDAVVRACGAECGRCVGSWRMASLRDWLGQGVWQARTLGVAGRFCCGGSCVSRPSLLRGCGSWNTCSLGAIGSRMHVGLHAELAICVNLFWWYGGLGGVLPFSIGGHAVGPRLWPAPRARGCSSPERWPFMRLDVCSILSCAIRLGVVCLFVAWRIIVGGATPPHRSFMAHAGALAPKASSMPTSRYAGCHSGSFGPLAGVVAVVAFVMFAVCGHCLSGAHVGNLLALLAGE